MAALVPARRSLRSRCVLCLLPVALVGAACTPTDESVDAGPLPLTPGLAIEHFEASRGSAPLGALVTLSWRTRAAAACTLAPEVGIVPRSGQLNVTLAATTTYTLSCEGSGEAVSADLTVQVLGGSDGGPSEDGGTDAGPLFELSGEVEEGEPESSLDELTDTSLAWLVREREGALLEEDLACDIHFPALYDGDSSMDEPGCVIPAGTSVDSYLLHGSPPPSGGPNELAGTVVFTREIVALQWRAETIGEGDRAIGRPGVSYGDPWLRYYGIGTSDAVTLEPDRRTLHFAIVADDIDELRIITLAEGEEPPLIRSTTLAPRSQVESLLLGARRSDDEALLFFEQTVTLEAPLEVDIIAPGAYEGPTAPTPDTLPAGTTVSSAIVHFDPAGGSGPVGLTVTLTLPKPILGLITDEDRLTNSDPLLGRPDTAYPTEGARGTELHLVDELWFAEDRRSLWLHLSAGSSNLDQLRVLYEP